MKKTQRVLYYIFLVVGIIGFINIVSQQIIKQDFGLIDVVASNIFGTVGLALSMTILPFWPLYLIIAYPLLRRSKKNSVNTSSNKEDVDN